MNEQTVVKMCTGAWDKLISQVFKIRWQYTLWKTSPFDFSNKFVKNWPISIIIGTHIGTHIPEDIRNNKILMFSTLPVQYLYTT